MLSNQSTVRIIGAEFPPLRWLLRESDACDLMRSHLDHWSARLAVEGPRDYLIDELMRPDKLLAEEPGGGSQAIALARSWNDLPMWARRALAVTYLAPRARVEVPPAVLESAHWAFRRKLSDVRRHAQQAEARSA